MNRFILAWGFKKHIVYSNVIHSQDVDLDKLNCLSMLGAGGFGQVLLVEYGGYHYALKCMKKRFVVDQGLIEHVKRERVGRVKREGGVGSSKRGWVGSSQRGRVFLLCPHS